MNVRNLWGAVTAVAVTCGVMGSGPAYAQLRDGNLMPQNQSGMITVAGCLMHGSDTPQSPGFERPRPESSVLVTEPWNINDVCLHISTV